MGKYPFGEYASRYMDSVRGVYAEETWKTRARRYRRMERRIIELKEQKRISTMSPKSMTEEDVREYILHCKSFLAQTDMVHEVNALRNLLLFAGNHAVDVCMNHNPGLRPRNKPSRKASMDEETYQRILTKSAQIDPTDYPRVRAYTLVLLCLNAGTRNKEIRLANVEDLDIANWVLHIVHVKGEDSYGQTRDVPIPPEIRQLVSIFLLGRKKTMVDKNCDSHALFPSNSSPDGYCSGNTLRNYKNMVERDLGIKFDLRQCRRTFGQRYLDRDLDIESVSVLMGHSTTRMTETFYSRRRLDDAMRKARGAWKEGEDRKEGQRGRCRIVHETLVDNGLWAVFRTSG